MPAIELTSLWLPILLATVFVFIASSIVHMATPMHKGDYEGLPNEDAVLEALRKHGVRPGMYRFPFACSMKEMGTPQMLEKLKRGPVGSMIVQPGGTSIGKSLVQWFLFSLLISVFAAYVGTMACPVGEHYLRVFRVTGTVAVLGYAVTNIDHSIWKGESWGVTARFFIDGVIYGLVTAGTFGWLWPQA